MSPTITKVHLSLLIFVGLAATALPALHAELRCPGSVASVTPRFVQRALIVIPVKINLQGPFDFIVDTGSQVTIVDPSLALELNLKSQGRVGLVSVASSAQASFAVLAKLEADSHTVKETPAVIQDLRQIQAADPRIRGVLGESFLSHFDMLIDYAHRMVCLDETNTMRNVVRGERIPLVTPQHPESEIPFMERLVISVHLSSTGSRDILLQLDSGSDGPILYPGNDVLQLERLARANKRGGDSSRAQGAFDLLPLQDMWIGSRRLYNISFVTPVGVAKTTPVHDEEGILPTVLFQRIFISGIEHYVVFDPR